MTQRKVRTSKNEFKKDEDGDELGREKRRRRRMNDNQNDGDGFMVIHLFFVFGLLLADQRRITSNAKTKAKTN